MKSLPRVLVLRWHVGGTIFILFTSVFARAIERPVQLESPKIQKEPSIKQVSVIESDPAMSLKWGLKDIETSKAWQLQQGSQIGRASCRERV